MTTRREHDLLGDRDVPSEAYYGVHTLRAVENFPITATPISIYPDLIAALASIKLAAAKSNAELTSCAAISSAGSWTRSCSSRIQRSHSQACPSR